MKKLIWYSQYFASASNFPQNIGYFFLGMNTDFWKYFRHSFIVNFTDLRRRTEQLPVDVLNRGRKLQ